GAIDQIKEITAEDPFLFLRLFTRGGPLPLVALLSFLVPLVAIGLGFDAVNGEHNRRTLSRILAQPIYRDALLFGKFAAGLFTLSVSLIVLWLLVVVLDPSVRSTQQSMLASLGLALIERGAIPDAPIPLLQSVLIVWPQIVGLVAGSILLFVIAYVVFQRQEVRA